MTLRDELDEAARDLAGRVSWSTPGDSGSWPNAGLPRTVDEAELRVWLDEVADDR